MAMFKVEPVSWYFVIYFNSSVPQEDSANQNVSVDIS